MTQPEPAAPELKAMVEDMIAGKMPYEADAREAAFSEASIVAAEAWFAEWRERQQWHSRAPGWQLVAAPAATDGWLAGAAWGYAARAADREQAIQEAVAAEAAEGVRVVEATVLECTARIEQAQAAGAAAEREYWQGFATCGTCEDGCCPCCAYIEWAREHG